MKNAEGPMFELVTPYAPCGDQQQAIQALTTGVTTGQKAQVLLGVTGSGKTFTMANVIANTNKPTLIIAHNKTLAAQLYQEFRSFFPHNAVEYFVSYYDYYQPEAYVARTDTYIEKDSAINDRIDTMRLSATRSLLERRDVIIVASVSCIYGLGLPEYYCQMNLSLEVGQQRKRDDILIQLVEMQYVRSDNDLVRKTFRSRGDTLDIFPAYEEDIAIRIEFFDTTVERISYIDPLTSKHLKSLSTITIHAGSHHVTPEHVREVAAVTIRQELEERHALFITNNRLLEAQRLHERVTYDIELLKEIGTCKGIENYSRHFSQRLPGQPPPCLIDYFPDDFLLFIDESHATVPQLGAMCNGDRARKLSLIEYGFRLPSAYDNRPLSFEEFQGHIKHVIYVSATPAAFELNCSGGAIVEQILRPTGLLDPIIEVRPSSTQVDDCLEEIRKEIENGGKILVTTLTKHLAEELTKYLSELGVKTRYMHSDIDVLERLRIVHDLRTGVFDVLVGINLLREGLDIPEVSLVSILDADKEGFLRSQTSLIQICGRAARNSKGRVIMYADTITTSIKNTITITTNRREKQSAYNILHNITPTTIIRKAVLLSLATEKAPELDSQQPVDLVSIRRSIKEWEAAMKKAAKEYRFEDAATARDTLRRLQQIEMESIEA
jgi:excinuclease ABC subunit B